MALTLDVTVGGVSSNSYLSVAEADTYHEGRLFSTDWTSATAETKKAALVWATRLLDAGFVWDGVVTDISTPQALNWPRGGMVDREGRTIDDNVIPNQIKNATAELARLLIVSDRAADRDTIGFESISVGPIKLAVDKLDEISTIPDAVYDLCRDFGFRVERQSAVSLIRV